MIRRKHILSGQISFFDRQVTAENHKRGNCFHCVAFESHRCRNQWIGDRPCPEGMRYEEYIGSVVKQCLCATVEIFQDGYIHCPIIECIGCEKCIEEFGDGSNFVYDESQNYKRKPDWE